MVEPRHGESLSAKLTDEISNRLNRILIRLLEAREHDAGGRGDVPWRELAAQGATPADLSYLTGSELIDGGYLVEKSGDSHFGDDDYLDVRLTPAGVDRALRAPAQQPLTEPTSSPQRRMTAEQARRSAEAIVKRDGWPLHRGKPTKRRLAEKVRCSPSTLNKAIDDSAKLRRALAGAGDPAGGAGQNDDLSRLEAEQELDDKSRHA